MRVAGGEATMAVIGSSHFFEVVAGGVVIAEMLVSSGPGLRGLPEPVRVGAGGEWRYEHRRGHVGYHFELYSSTCSSEVLRETTARLATPGPNRLSYVFPEGEGAPGAITCLEWQLDVSRITVETYHTFPGEPAIVRSRSVVDISERGVAP